MGGFGNTLGLLFEISADPSKAEAALKQFEASVAQHLGVSLKSFQQFGAAVEASAKDLAIIGGGVVAVAAGFLELANRAAEAGAKIYEAHEKTGFTAESLSGLSAISRTTGENFDSLTAALARAGRNLAVGINEPAKGTGKILSDVMGSSQQLEALGLRPMDERIQIVLQRIFALNDVGQRNLALQALLGRGWQTNVETLKFLAEQGYAPAIAKAKEFGLFFDEDSARRAKEFTIGMNSLKAEVSGLALSIGQQVMPYALQFLAWLHTASADAQIFALRAKALAEALLAPATGGLTLIAVYKNLHEASKLESAAIQEQTNWLVGLQAMMKGASDAAKNQTLNLAGLAGGHEKAAAAAKEHAAATRDLGVELPPVIAEMERIEKSKVASVVHQQAIEILGLSKGLDPPVLKMPKLTSEVAQLGVVAVPTFSRINEVIRDFRAVAPNTLDAFADALGKNAAQAIVFGASISDAMGRALKATLASIASEAMVRAIYETAMGFASLAVMDFRAATLHFESAGIFAGIGALTAGVGAAIPGGGTGSFAGGGRGLNAPAASARAAGPSPGGSAGGSVAPAAPAALAPGSAAAQRAGLSGQPQTVIHMEFKGPVYGGKQGLQELASHLTKAVDTQDVVLHASHTVNPPPVSRGRS